jgi:hypothetical protein
MDLDNLKASLKDQEAFIEEAALDAAFEEGVDASIVALRKLEAQGTADTVDDFVESAIERLERLKEVVIG